MGNACNMGVNLHVINLSNHGFWDGPERSCTSNRECFDSAFVFSNWQI